MQLGNEPVVNVDYHRRWLNPCEPRGSARHIRLCPGGTAAHLSCRVTEPAARRAQARRLPLRLGPVSRATPKTHPRPTAKKPSTKCAFHLEKG
ncbi:hypothetical protein SKAU_G00241130 [Synaphobranchus kaupii]|uniref:Uncharacterized protein n=1 Tax=Synaphobranchus kaupii TaxID=118154 RepID=A0A9Q1F7H1_SYNKA|nr:hypothetical protein SKAU_G00241130 [Synaphobranchus kaupii]